MSVVAGHKPVQDSQVFSFGDSTIEVTEFGLQKRFTLNDNLLEASEKEVYAIVEDRGSRSSRELPRERPDLENYMHVRLPNDLEGRFPYNDRIVSKLNPNYPDQSVYIALESLVERNGKIYAIKDTVLSAPFGCLENLDFEGEETFFKEAPLILNKDTEVSAC